MKEGTCLGRDCSPRPAQLGAHVTWPCGVPFGEPRIHPLCQGVEPRPVMRRMICPPLLELTSQFFKKKRGHVFQLPSLSSYYKNEENHIFLCITVG